MEIIERLAPLFAQRAKIDAEIAEIIEGVTPLFGVKDDVDEGENPFAKMKMSPNRGIYKEIRDASSTEGPDEEEAPTVKKKLFKHKPCCGSNGPRHKAGCPYSNVRVGNEDKIEDKMEDLKDLHAWECIGCGKIVETRIDEYTMPCTKCGGTLVQKF